MDFDSLRAQRKAELMNALKSRSQISAPIKPTEADEGWKKVSGQAAEMYNKSKDSDMTKERKLAESQEMEVESEDAKRGKFIKAIKGRKQETMMA